MEAQEIEFEQRTDAATVAAYLENVARNLREGKVKVSAEGESVDFNVVGEVEFEVEAEYNAAKKKYSLELNLDWREPS